MKKIVTLLVFVMAMTSGAQTTINKQVGDFHEIKVFDLIEVNMIQSNDNRIVIKGEKGEDIKWVNKDGVLKLRMRLNAKFKGENTFIEVYHTNVDVIDANEGARITCNELVTKNKLELRAQEGAKIRIGMNVSVLDVRAVTGGIVEATGLAKNQYIVLNTGGVFEGSDLKTSISNVKIQAGGEAEVFASERVDINVKAGGDVKVYGNPKDVRKKTFAGGRISIM